MPTETAVTIPELKVALAKIVHLMDLYGDKYWPIFERLERELEELESRPARLAKFRNSELVVTPPIKTC